MEGIVPERKIMSKISTLAKKEAMKLSKRRKKELNQIARAGRTVPRPGHVIEDKKRTIRENVMHGYRNGKYD